MQMRGTSETAYKASELDLIVHRSLFPEAPGWTRVALSALLQARSSFLSEDTGSQKGKVWNLHRCSGTLGAHQAHATVASLS